MLGSSLRQVTRHHMRVVAPVDEEIDRAESRIAAPAAPEAAAAPGPEETQGMRLEREARDPCSRLAENETVGATAVQNLTCSDQWSA